jgi:hypothetical protein
MSIAARDAGHLCPKMLEKELAEFRRLKGYFPRVVIIHLSPEHEPEIEREVREVAKSLSISIDIAHEGEELIL